MSTLLATSSEFAVSLGVLVGLAYLLLLRLVDLNEKEPAWGLGLALLLGGSAGVLVPVFVSAQTLTLEPFWGALAECVALFLALAVVLVALEGIGRLRGWSEVNGVLDGVVYGAASGLGLASGLALSATLRSSGLFDELFGISAFDRWWTAALAGLVYGLVGAILGAGFGFAFESGSRATQLLYPLAGLAGGVLFLWLYRLLFDGTRWGGTGGLVLAWAGLLLPLLLVACVIVFALTRERQAIAVELADDVASGLISEDDLRLLTSPSARRANDLRLLFSGDLDAWAHARTLHNRSAQLALVERRARGLEGERKAAAEAEAARLRAAIAELRGREPVASPGTASSAISGRMLPGIIAAVSAVAIAAGYVLIAADRTGEGSLAIAARSGQSTTTPAAVNQAKPSPKVQAGLRKLVRKQAGQFTLVPGSIARYDAMLAAGALGALSMTYRATSGATVDHVIALMRSTNAAEWAAYASSAGAQADGWTLTESSSVTSGSQGQVVGRRYVLQATQVILSNAGGGGIVQSQMVLWNYGAHFFATGTAPAPLAYQLALALPY